MRELFTRIVFYDYIARGIFDFEIGISWLNGSKKNADVKNIRSTAKISCHTGWADGKDFTTIHHDTHAGIEGAITVIGGAVHYGRAAVEIKPAVAIYSIASGIDINVAAVDSKDAVFIGIEGIGPGTIFARFIGAATSVNTIIVGDEADVAIVNGNNLGF